MKHVNIFLVILQLTAGCGGNKPSGNDDLITVDVTKSYPKKELILQDFMDVEYIPLETGGEFYCQGIVRAIGRDFIIVTNASLITDGDIFIFDRNGKGLRKINRLGRGGKEYQNITGIILDEENCELFVNDFPPKRIMVYDLYGRFKRSLRYNEGSNYRVVFNFDRESLICRENSLAFEQGVVEMPPFILISKQDGSIVNEILIPFEQKKITYSLIINGQSVTAIPTDATGIKNISVINIDFSPIIPYHDSWILTEPSSDTVFQFLPDCSMIPFMVRTPSIQTMNPEIYLFPKVLTDRYYLIETVKKEQEYPKTHLVYDKQEQTIYEYTQHNGDYSDKRIVGMSSRPINNEIAFWQKIEADELVEDYEKGVLKGKLKEIAAKLKEEDNPVIMLVKHKK